MEGRGAAARTDEGRAFGTNLSLNISSTPKRHPKKPGKKHRCSGIKPPLVPLKRISEIDERSAQDHDDWDDDGMLNPLILMESDSPSLPNGEDGPEIDLFRSWSTAKRQVHALEERLEDEMQRAAESAKDHSAAIKILEERIARAESDRDGLRRKLARERSKASTLAADLARASRDVEKEKRRSLERAGEHSEVVARLEGDIAAAESDRDGAQLETKEVVARLEHRRRRIRTGRRPVGAGGGTAGPVGARGRTGQGEGGRRGGEGDVRPARRVSRGPGSGPGETPRGGEAKVPRSRQGSIGRRREAGRDDRRCRSESRRGSHRVEGVER
mmetsp:Transcript_50056/g.106515  ORF Transcript_50056/g.106515 Transcript_50056/m.106515 type:complete len:329 (+) Transcript_50056:158-1144(+)